MKRKKSDGLTVGKKRKKKDEDYEPEAHSAASVKVKSESSLKKAKKMKGLQKGAQAMKKMRSVDGGKRHKVVTDEIEDVPPFSSNTVAKRSEKGSKALVKYERKQLVKDPE